MELHFELNDKEFERQFEHCTLNPEIFSHEAHLRLAWIHIKNYGIDTAIDNICHQLVAYVDAVGARDKYNKTLTIAAIRAVYHFMLKSQSDDFESFITESPRLKFNFRELLGFHYAIDIYENARAKQEYLEPDLLPFD